MNRDLEAERARLLDGIAVGAHNARRVLEAVFEAADAREAAIAVGRLDLDVPEPLRDRLGPTLRLDAMQVRGLLDLRLHRLSAGRRSELLAEAVMASGAS